MNLKKIGAATGGILVVLWAMKAAAGPEYGSPEYTLEEARVAVAAKLKGPSSAQFAEVRISGNGTVCGTVNGKNGFGAYAGAKRFLMIPTGSQAFSAERMEFGAFIEGDAASVPTTAGLVETDFWTLYSIHCLGENREKLMKDKAAFMAKFGAS